MTTIDGSDAARHPTDATPVDVEVRGRVLWVHLARPEALNAIDRPMLAGLDAAIDRACEPDVRVVVLRGRGRAFCSGVDLRQVGGDRLDVDALLGLVDDVARVVTRLAALPRPTIAGLNGVTAAGGLELSLACDLTVAARSARIGDAHSNFGLLPGGGGSFRLARIAGIRLAKQLMFTGALMPASELVGTGLVGEVVDDDRLDDRLEELSAGLAARSPLALSAMKRLVDAAYDRTDEEATAAELAELAGHVRGPDVVEGIRAFREGRVPRFDDGLALPLPPASEED